ncbi:MAG: YgaP family membrane protein [Chloroflexota bacterium]
MNRLFLFVTSTTGRAARVIAGVILLAIGAAIPSGAARWTLIVIGLLPIVTGALNLCFLAAFFGLPIQGDALRARLVPGEENPLP